MDVRMPDGTIITNVPDNITQSELLARYNKFATPEEKSGFFRQALDVPTGIAKGAVSGVGMLVNLFGADTPAAKAISGAQDYLNSLMSAQARNDQKEIARIMQEAEGKGVGEEVKAAVKAFATAPVDFLSQALGTAAPAIAAGLGASVLGAGALGATAVGALTGAGMGAGVVKGTIYDETKQALLDAGMDPKQAEARASLAQEYGGKNLDMILSGAALGGLAATTGVEKALIGPLSRRILGQAAAKEAGKEAAEQAAKGVVRRTATGAAAEAAPEFAQAAQEQFAANLAAQREGLERDLLAGVAGAGTLEALAGAGLGGGIGAVSRGAKAEAKPGEEPVAETRQEPKVTTYQTTDFDGKPIQVQVTEDPNTGDITAVGPDGDEVDLTPFMRGTTTIPDVLAKIYGGEEAAPVEPEVPAEPEVPPAEPPGEIPVTPTPEAPAPAAPEPEVPAVPEAPAVPPVEPEAPVTPPAEEPVTPVTTEAPVTPVTAVTPEPTVTEEPAVTPVTPEPTEAAPEPKAVKPTSPITARTIQGTPAQVKKAENFAKKELGEVVYQDGDTYMYRRYNSSNGRVEYPVRIGNRQVAKDILHGKAGRMDLDLYRNLIQEARRLEKESLDLEQTNPFMKFDQNGIGISEDIDPRLAGVIQDWKKTLGLQSNVFIATDKFIEQNYPKFVGKERGIIGLPRGENRRGATMQLANGNRVIFFRQGPKISRMMETIAHEMGHIHQEEVFDRADPATKKALRDAHAKWLESTKGKTIAEFIPMLRAKGAAKGILRKSPQADQIPAEKLSAYWRSFSEWYADQTARWAVSQKEPTTIVEKYFARLGKAMRDFYAKLKNAGYLPNETFVQYLNKVKPAVDLTPPEVTEEPGPIIEEAEAAVPTDAGRAAVETTNKLGRGVQAEPTFAEKMKRIVTGDPGAEKITPEVAKKATKRFLDNVETYVFSSDAALNNAIRRVIRDTTMSDEQKMGALLHISSSQAVHADALANAFMRYGMLDYDQELHKYRAIDDKNNLVAMVQKVADIAKQYGMTQPEAERVAHTAFEAKRLRGLQEANQRLETEIEKLRKEAREGPTQTSRDLARKEIRRKTKDFKYIHMTDEQIDEALALFDSIPELNDVVEIWNGIRENAAKELVESGLWSPEEADILLANVDYVPFYREDQLEKGKGPKEFLRNLQVQAKEKKLKGSDKPVADIFDNMARWTQYAIKRSVLNRQAVALVDTAAELGFAEKVKSKREGENTVRVWRDGNEEYYKMADPLFMEAFKGLEGVSIPTLKLAAKFANMLRQSVVLYPLFSIAQVPQDAFAAMFSSGLKTRYALTIPARAVKEFIMTLAKRSQTHKELERFGAVGIRDFTSAIAREDAEVTAGLKARPGVGGKIKSVLEHISMASDNAVRQAVYEASMAQGDSQAAAIEKAFQLINFRNRGSSKEIAMAGQLIPFFNAYLAAQHVAIKVISGRGISPQDRSEALKTLAYTTTALMALSLIYAMMIADDEDYKKKPSVMRDRLFMIPGTGLSVPIRQDIFSIPKILTEHLYLLMTDNGSEDGRKFRDSMKAALFNAVASPTPVPQVVKPIAEVIMNYNYFQGRPLIGTYQKTLETERQFTDSTSELAKLLGSTGMISPIAADHLIRGMFGSVGGLTIYMTNPLLDSFGESSRPEMSAREMLATLPGTSGFVSKPNETALKNDFYVLRDEVAKVANTLNDMKARSPQDIEEYLKDEDNLNKLGLKPAVDRITSNLSTIRRAISRINNMPDSQMSPTEKAKQIDELRKTEQEMLEGLDIKSLRKMAGL